MLADTMQQEEIPIPPAIIIAMITAAFSNFHTGCNFFQFTVVFQVDTERPTCDARSMGVPGYASSFAFYFLLPYFTIICEIMLSPQYNLGT